MKSIKQAVLDKQIDLLFSYSGTVVTSGIAVGLFAWIYFSFVIDSLWLVLWGVSLVGVNLARLYLLQRFKRINKAQAILSIWLRRHLILTFVSGLIWGLLSLAYDPNWATSHQVMLVMLLTGLAAFSITAYAAVLEVYVVFLIPLLLPLELDLVARGEIFTSLLAVLLLMFAIGMLFVARRFYIQYIESIHLSFEHQFLQKELMNGSQHLESMEHALKNAEQQFDNVLETSLDGYWEWDLQRDDLYLSPRWKAQLGYKDHELKSELETWKNLLHPDDRNVILEKLDNYLEHPRGHWEAEFRLLNKSGGYRGILARATPTLDEQGKLIRLTGVHIDITERVKAENKIKKLAYYDRLTKLPNRMLFNDRISHAISQAKHTGLKLCILFLDLDRFKNINDSFGHPAGDHVLKMIAERLRKVVREDDTLARLGGDEFAVLVENVHHSHHAALMAGKIKSSFEESFVVGGHDFYISGSIGISVYPNDGADAASLLKNADAAMYKAKSIDRGGFQFYTEELSENALQHYTIDSGLRQALSKQQFSVLYQPKIDLSSGSIKGAEALVRWRHPQLGEIPPEQFIPIAEETGQIRGIGEWVLSQACKTAQEWQSQGLDVGRMAVNLSGIQLMSDDFLETVKSILLKTGLPTELLELEVTENILMRDSEKSINTLDQLQSMGINIAIDDFGTGYSSLAQLTTLPVDKLKIDRSFVTTVCQDQQSAEISRTIIALGRTLNKVVIAEGIEYSDQQDFLRQEGCDEGQGFLFSRPMTGRQFIEFAENNGQQARLTTLQS
ncbi:MAG: EAL domain-containing protein [Candidatus Thiodiazotropha taylori]|nr:EAL domain-containing protein [Candidatus Thiodiazotropha taylori]MCG7924192.1 EAL domain-containing protein [Candidatus Thiodiazotropha taylori]MCG7970470.1 EAL domain-containing protein [Candidatus Thiodiazotropha taylori]MCG7976352.1 EAL domain-containing protein [Candidatus Thiodiazotropha taylori]